MNKFINELPELQQTLLRYINETPVLLSLLYDLNLLPEQLDCETKEWCHMMLIAAHFKQAVEQANKRPGVHVKGENETRNLF